MSVLSNESIVTFPNLFSSHSDLYGEQPSENESISSASAFLNMFPSSVDAQNAVPIPTEITVGVEIINDDDLTENDVILGRGAKSNNHEGNKSFRKLVKDSRPAYLEAKKLHDTDTKRRIAQSILVAIQGKGDRFLKPVWTRNKRNCNMNRGWTIIEDKNALKKIKQALRDGNFKWINE